jgi:hypothetical protein
VVSDVMILTTAGLTILSVTGMVSNSVMNVLANLKKEWKHGVNSVLLVVKTDLIVLLTILIVTGLKVATSLSANALQEKEWKPGKNTVRQDVMMKVTVRPIDITVFGRTMIHLMMSNAIVN